MRRILTLLSTLIFPQLVACIASSPEESVSNNSSAIETLPAEVNTNTGTIRGVVAPGGASISFLGIPYAAPPVGALRWQPPTPPADWTGVRDANAAKPACAQPTQTPAGAVTGIAGS